MFAEHRCWNLQPTNIAVVFVRAIAACDHHGTYTGGHALVRARGGFDRTRAGLVFKNFARVEVVEVHQRHALLDRFNQFAILQVLPHSPHTCDGSRSFFGRRRRIEVDFAF